MNIVLLSGGSGKRLWPLSNHARSKQFLQLLKGEHGQPESMLQRVYRQVKKQNEHHRVVIATNQIQVDAIHKQISKDIELVIEPERRNTFPAVALSVAYLVLEGQADLDEVVAVLPVDPYVEHSYFDCLEVMKQGVEDGVADLLLMGIKPTYPSEKYGYITYDAQINKNYVLSVYGYEEKPTLEQAKCYIEQGACWNAGVFVFKLRFIYEYLKEIIDFKTYDDVISQYHLLKKTSFDREIVEHIPSKGVVLYGGEWKDLGTWNTITEEMEEATIGEVMVDDATVNSHVINELDIPMIVLGGENLIVAASPDGILISDKQKSSYMKPFVDQINNRPMFEKRRWGEYKVLDYVTYEDGQKSLTKHLIMEPEECISYQSHGLRTEIWTIVDGSGILILNDKAKNVVRGDVIQIPQGMKHAMKAITQLHFIEVQMGIDLVEDDIKRYEFDWNNI